MPLGGAMTNRTLLLALLAKCRQAILKEMDTNQDNSTTAAPTSSSVTTTRRQSYDNAYFYILFVMFFYSFMALALMRGFVRYDTDKKDPYEEFMKPTESLKKHTSPVDEKIDFEENSV